MSRRRYNRISQKERKKITDMYNTGQWKVPELAEMFRVTTRRIYQIIGEAELEYKNK